MQMKILFISTSLPPNYDSQTIRNLHFIRGLFENSITVETLSVSDKSNEEVHDELFSKYVSCFHFTEVPSMMNFLNNLKNFKLKYLLTNLANYLLAPDLYVGWKKKAVLKFNTDLSEKKYDLIITTSGSYVAHSIGAEISSNLKIPLVSDLGDPWADNPIWPENMFHKRIINNVYRRSRVHDYLRTLR